MKLTELAMRNRLAVFFTVILITVGGVAAYLALPVAIFPELTIPRIKTIAEAGDTPPDALMVTATRPIEQVIATVPHVHRIRSTTERGSTEITTDFDWHTDMAQSLALVNARITALKETLPATAKVQSEIMDPSLFPIMGFSLTSRTRSQEDLFDYAQYQFRPRLARIAGIRDIQVAGTRIREIRVSVNPQSLQSYGIAATDIGDAIRKANLVQSVGQFNDRYLRHLVLIDNRVTTIEAIQSVIVGVRNRTPIRLSDVARVEYSAQPQNVVLEANGQPAVLVNLLRQPTSNTVVLADNVHTFIDQIRRELPSDTSLQVFYDQSGIVQESEGSVRDAVIVGAVLAGAIQILFLGSFSSAGVVFLMLPVAVATALIALLPMGRSLNIMTLGAIAISLGLVIDDAVVVVENIYRYLEMGADPDSAIRDGMREITPAMLGSSATTLVVFLPLLFLTGVPGNFFQPVSLTMVVALTASLLLSLTFVPLLARMLLKAPKRAHDSSRRPTVFSRIDDRYRAAIQWCLLHRAFVYASLIPTMIVGWILFRGLKTGFMPEMDEGGFTLDYFLPAGTSLQETDRVCNGIGRLIMAMPDVSAYSRRTGTQLGFFITTQNRGDILVKLKPRSQRREIDDVIDELRQKIQSNYSDVGIDFTQILQDMLGDLSGTPQPIEVKIYGSEMKVLGPLAHQVGKVVGSVKGVVDVNDGIIESGPDDVVTMDPERAAQAGLTPDQVASQLNTALFGDVVTTVRQGERQTGVRVSLPQGLYHTPESLREIPIVSPDNTPYPLGSLAAITSSSGSMDLNRENQRLMVAVTARTSGIDLGTAVQAIRTKLTRMKLPTGVTVEFGGLYESQQSSFRELSIMLLVVAFLTLAVLLVYFGSFAESAALLAAGVLSLSGVAASLCLTGTPLDISSFAGSILVIGIVVEGSFFLLDSARHFRQNGLDPFQALVQAGGLRLRPILMTKLTAILTLFPLALGLGAGAEMQKPLAIAVIGGVSLSGLFTLFITPTLYASLSGLRAPEQSSSRRR